MAGISAGTIEAFLTLDTQGFSMGLNNARQDLQTFTDGTRTTGDRFTALGGAISNVGATLTKNVTLPIIGIGTAAAKTAMDFEFQMSRVESISGAVGDDLAMLEQQAKDLGKSTQYSAIQVSEGMENLASAGFEANEIYAAMPGLLNLAASDNIDLASAAEIAAGALRGFGLEASQTGHVADVLAESAARTNASVSSMGSALSYVAPVSKAMGISMEETAAAVGLLSNANITGTKAGTSLRGALSRLAKPSEKAAEAMEMLGFNAYDSQGNMKSLSGIIGSLQNSMQGLTQEERNNALVTIFGQEALSGLLVLMEAGPQAIDDLTASYQSCDGAAQKMADTMMDNAKGSWIELQSALEGAAIAIGEVLIPHIKKAVEWVTDMVTAFGNLDPAVQENIVKWGAIAAAIGPVLSIGGKFISLIGTMSTALSSLGGVFATLAGPVGWIALLGTAIAGLAIAWNKTQDALTESTGGFVEAANNLEDFEGKVRTTDTLITKLFGEKVKIEFSAEFDQVKEDTKNYYNNLIKDTEDFYKRKWDIDHDGCQDMEEHYKHMEEQEIAYRERMADRMTQRSDLDNKYDEAMSGMTEYLSNNLGMNNLDIGDFQGNMSKWVQEQIDIVKNGENEIEIITRRGITARGYLLESEQKQIAKIEEEIANSRTVINAAPEDMYNAFKAYHIKEGIMYDEKGQRISKFTKEFGKSMKESTDTLVDGYLKQIETLKEHDRAFGTNSENTIRELENQATAVQSFSDIYTNRTNENIAAGQEFEVATQNAFRSIVRDLNSGEINVEEFGMSTQRYLELAMDSMINAGASADDLAWAINNVPADKRAQVKAYVEGKTDAEQLKAAIDRLKDKNIKVITQYENWYTDKKTGYQYGYQNGVAGYYPKKATGTDFALGGLTEVAEYGPEIIATKNRAMLATGRQLIDLAGGEKIYNARQTKDILDNMGKSTQIDYSDSLRIINSNIILLKEAIERKNFSNVVNNNIEKIDINEVANIEEIEYQLTEMMERRTYGGV